MASYDLLTPVLDNMTDVSNGVVAFVNSDVAAGTLDDAYLARGPRDAGYPRERSEKAAVVEIVPSDRVPTVPVGTGFVEAIVTLELRVIVRLSDKELGATQVATAEKIARSIEARYNNVNAHGITPPSGVTNAGSTAAVIGIDENPSSGYTIATVIVGFRFLRPYQPAT